jgi:hypothetical protein
MLNKPTATIVNCLLQDSLSTYRTGILIYVSDRHTRWHSLHLLSATYSRRNTKGVLLVLCGPLNNLLRFCVTRNSSLQVLSCFTERWISRPVHKFKAFLFHIFNLLRGFRSCASRSRITGSSDPDCCWCIVTSQKGFLIHITAKT